MATIAGWVLLAATAASGAQPTDVTHEAVCGLKALFTLERSHLQEKDRYELSTEKLGFLPLPCPDATRPPTSGDNSLGGCRFVFTILAVGQDLESINAPEALRAEAVGVGLGVKGLRLVLDGQGRISRAHTGTPIPEPDCEAWRREADPLWRYHDAVSEHDCTGGPYDPSHPCTQGFEDLAALARAGVGVARKEYAEHPTARELVPIEPPTPAMSLCGLLASPERRAHAADTLERGGQLLTTVLAPRCHTEGLRVALPRILRRFGAVCPGEHCLELLALARDAQLPGQAELLRTHTSQVADAVLQHPSDTRLEYLHRVTGLSYVDLSPLDQALEGKWEGLRQVGQLKREPLVLALLERARRVHPELAPRVALLHELWGRETASDATFRAWTVSATCGELGDARELNLTLPRMRFIVETQTRCQGSPVGILERYTATLPPRDLMKLLEPLPAEHLVWMRAHLGLDDPKRAEALVDWVVDRQPKLLEALRITVPVAQRLLSPRNVDRQGGRVKVLESLLRGYSGKYGPIEADAWRLLYKEALQGTPSPELVRDLASRRIPPEEKKTLLAGVLRSPDVCVRAAAAAGLAETKVDGIPRDAARAYLEEIRPRFLCIQRIAERLGSPPPGKRIFPLIGCGADPVPALEQPKPPPPPQPLEDYCSRLGEESKDCWSACDGIVLDEEAHSRLETAAGESVPYPAAHRACAYNGP
ncbi:hypothetical protein JQX13_39290 [Archangium violaceum]|uniref:hypothetical protein n=1 Tax=Archangium violaceum TaxID=83451 RepID=UPI00193B3F0B|nr:hypothetical protein [Archangium violaceum]QRK06118.1 hypothetical protein JQX13_39290 [Archangium violaceum]